MELVSIKIAEAVNKIAIGEWFEKNEIMDIVGCTRDGMNYMFGRMRARHEIIAKRIPGTVYYKYKKIKKISLDFDTRRSCHSFESGKCSDLEKKFYFGGNPETFVFDYCTRVG